MNFYIKYLFIIIPLFSIIGCETSAKNGSTYFGGNIKNPKDINVTIFKGGVKIATTELNQDQKFLFKIDSLESGLYTFKHGEEFQYIYLEPKDSLLIRLNTWDFDESLVFNGKGAERNNFLIQLFLDNEQQEKLFYNYFSLGEAEFIQKIDSLKKIKSIQYEQFKTGTSKQSKGFNALVKTAIDFPFYTYKEKYALLHKHLNKLDKLPSLSDDFYNFREELNINTNSFTDYYSFKNYLWNYLYNTTAYKKESNSVLQFSTLLLQQIVKTVSNSELKNEMLQKTYFSSLINDDCSKNDKDIAHNIFFKNCSDTKIKKEIDTFITVINTQKKGSLFPEISIKNTADNIFNSSNIITKNTVIYSWPKGLNQIQNMAKRVNYLTGKYPNIKFIGIDTQLDNYNWKAYIRANNLEAKNQFQLVDKANNNLFSHDIPRAIIMDGNRTIVSNFTYLSHNDFEKKLSVLENNLLNNALTKK